MGKRTLSKAIEDMRRNAHQEHVDIWFNTKVGKTIIKNFKSLRPGDYSGSDVGDTSVREKGKNRKRVQEEDVEEDDELPPQSDSPVPPVATSKTPKLRTESRSVPQFQTLSHPHLLSEWKPTIHTNSKTAVGDFESVEATISITDTDYE